MGTSKEMTATLTHKGRQSLEPLQRRSATKLSGRKHVGGVETKAGGDSNTKTAATFSFLEEVIT